MPLPQAVEKIPRMKKHNLGKGKERNPNAAAAAATAAVVVAAAAAAHLLPFASWYLSTAAHSPTHKHAHTHTHTRRIHEQETHVQGSLLFSLSLSSFIQQTPAGNSHVMY